MKDLIEAVLEDTGYRKELEEEEGIEAKTRLENIGELLSKAADFGDRPEDEDALGQFLEEVALVADVDSVDSGEERVVLMTLHAAKGLEFPKVYLSGMEEGLFPGKMSIDSSDPDDLEEERRLCYVGMTRAREVLILTAARSRMINGETRYYAVSRFISEIPRELLQTRERSAAQLRNETGRRLAAMTGGGTAGAWGRSAVPGGAPGRERTPAGGDPLWRPGREFTVEKSDSLSYGVGDRVRHVKFGAGTVTALTEGKRDYEVTVQFDRYGEKKLFASFAKLVKEEQ